MTDTNRYKLLWSLILLSGILVFPVMASTLEIDDETFSDVGVTKLVEIKLNGTTNGLTGYIMDLYLEDPSLAEIISVDFRPWAVLNLNSTLPSDDCYLLAADMDEKNTDKTAVRIINVTVRADAPGTTNLSVGSYQFLDNDYVPITPTIQGGLLTIQDNIPPASVTDLHNTTYLPNDITWTWTDPADADFAKAMVYLDGVFKQNVTKGTESFSAGSLTPGTSYTIGTHTVDTSDNINATWVNQTATTKPTTGATGTLYISSNPTGAGIEIDGVYQGTTPKVVYNVAGGSRNVTLTKVPYLPKTLWVTVEEGRLQMVYWRFIGP